MKLLLDTHTFIWWDDAPAKLSASVLSACENTGNSLYLSLASVWELQIKEQLGKVALPLPIADLLRKHEEKNRLFIEPIARDDIFALSALPPHHRDPFDRLIIAQARRGGFQLVTCDPEIALYDVPVLW